jgi:hypothetical protein
MLLSRLINIWSPDTLFEITKVTILPAPVVQAQVSGERDVEVPALSSPK